MFPSYHTGIDLAVELEGGDVVPPTNQPGPTKLYYMGALRGEYHVGEVAAVRTHDYLRDTAYSIISVL